MTKTTNENSKAEKKTEIKNNKIVTSELLNSTSEIP